MRTITLKRPMAGWRDYTSIDQTMAERTAMRHWIARKMRTIRSRNAILPDQYLFDGQRTFAIPVTQR